MTTRVDQPDMPVIQVNTLQAVLAFIIAHRIAFISLTVFLINLVLVSPSLMPGFLEVNPDDEAKYVESGWMLLEGNIRDLAWGPLVSLVYAPLHLIVGHLPDWFVLEIWMGRFILFSFLWWATYYLASQFKEQGVQTIALAVLFIATPFFLVIRNQSDALFIGFTALALAHVIKYSQQSRLKDIGMASLMVGLGVTARIETIVLVITLVILAIILGRAKHKISKILLFSILPVLGVLAIYSIASLILIGRVNPGLAYKSYDSFEWNQAILTGGDVSLARQETARLFGTQEENRGSILRAISRNPAAFAIRILANAKTIPDNYFDFFGKKLGAIVLFLAAWGVYFLVRRKALVPLIILLTWPLHTLIALGFLALHIIPQVVYLPLLLASIGIAGLFSDDSSRGEKRALFGSSLLILTLSWVAGKPAFGVVFLLVVGMLLLGWLVQWGWREPQHARLISLFLLLGVGLILREPYPFPDYPELGKSLDEQAVHFLEEAYPAQTSILVPSPLAAIAARMNYVLMEDIPEEVTSVEDLGGWLKAGGVEAVQVDNIRRVRNDIYDLFERDYEAYFEAEYSSEDGRIKVFGVR